MNVNLNKFISITQGKQVDNFGRLSLQTHNDYQFHHYTHFHEAKNKNIEDVQRTNAQGRNRGQFFEAESEAEDKILASRPACPRGLNITAKNMTIREFQLQYSNDRENYAETILANTLNTCTKELQNLTFTASRFASVTKLLQYFSQNFHVLKYNKITLEMTLSSGK